MIARGGAQRRYLGFVEDSATELTDYSEDGVDLTLIRWFLSLTPRERLEFLQNQINDILAIRERDGIQTNYDREQPDSASHESLHQRS